MSSPDLQEVKSDVKQILAEIGAIKETQIEHTVILKEHIRRTEAAEARITTIERWLLGLLSAILVGIVVKVVLKA